MGLYYPFWLLPFAIGLGAVCVRTVRCLRERKSGFEGLVLINLLAGGLQCCVILVNVNRMNAVHIPILLCVAYGVYTICAGVRAQLLRRQVRVAVAATYALCFMLFIGMYASSYNDVISTTFRAGLREALAHAPVRAREHAHAHQRRGVRLPDLLFSGKSRRLKSCRTTSPSAI